MSVSYSGMNNAIIAYINSKIPKDQNKAHIGTVRGNSVIIGNTSYSYYPTVDLYFGDGDKVACLLPENTSEVAVVGVI